MWTALETRPRPSIPIALDEAVRAGKVQADDIVVLNGCGGGLTWGASVARW